FGGEALIGPEKEMQRLLETKRAFLRNHADGRVGRKPDRQGVKPIAQVVGTAGHARAVTAPAASRPQANPDTRATDKRPDDASERDGAVGSIEPLEVGTKVDDFDRIARCIAVAADEDRGVADIALFDGGAAF